MDDFASGVQELESQYSGQHILLVSHGDTLSVLQATFYGSPLTQHRQYGLATAELRKLGQCSCH
jgi:broad specificity phosphatase PhoE